MCFVTLFISNVYKKLKKRNRFIYPLLLLPHLHNRLHRLLLVEFGIDLLSYAKIHPTI